MEKRKFTKEEKLNIIKEASDQNSYSETQWRERQINLSFTYRFNRKKTERDQPRNQNGGEDGDYMRVKNTEKRSI